MTTCLGRERRLAAVVGLVLLMSGAAGGATAYVQLPDASTDQTRFAASRAAVLPDGPSTTATLDATTGRDVTASFTALAPLRGVVLGHTLRRDAAGTVPTSATTPEATTTCAASPCAVAAVPDGSWVFSTSATAGSWSGAPGARSSPVLVDRTAPAVSASTSPAVASSDWSNAAAVTVTVTADDTNAAAKPSPASVSGIRELSVTTGSDQPQVTAFVAPYAASRSATTTVTKEGATAVAFTAKDAYGSSSEGGSTTVRLDRTSPSAPTVTNLSATAQYASAGGGNKTVWPGEVRGAGVTDALSGAAAVQLAVEVTPQGSGASTLHWRGPVTGGYATGSRTFHDLPTCTVQTSGSYACTFPVSWFSTTKQPHTLSLRTRDRAGNTSSVSSTTVEWNG